MKYFPLHILKRLPLRHVEAVFFDYFHKPHMISTYLLNDLKYTSLFVDTETDSMKSTSLQRYRYFLVLCLQSDTVFNSRLLCTYDSANTCNTT